MTRRSWTVSSAALLLTGASLLASGCDDSESQWGAPVGGGQPVGLSGAVALTDEPLGRILFLSVSEGRTLHTQSEEIGQNVAATVASPDLSRLFVLSRGVFPRVNEDDEGPQLAVFDGSAGREGERLVKSFALDDPMEQLAIDPAGKWVAAFGGDATVVNPNELVLFELDSGEGTEGEAVSKTIRSFGGSPLELIFTDELAVPGGPARRFLIVRTDRDVTLVDLLNLDDPEITIKLPEGATGAPAQIVYDDGEPDSDKDARLAIRQQGSADVVIAQLGEPSADSERDFSVVVNFVDVGADPSSIDFVRTDGGLRLAALVPSLARAVLVDPRTTLAEVVDLPTGFTSMRRITSVVDDAPEDGDVALLWGATPQIAFWSLGSSSETPYRSVATATLTFNVQEVVDVPAPNQHLKVLKGAGTDVFVLDLNKRQSFPLLTDFYAGDVQVSPDGARLWVYQGGDSNFSAVNLGDLHPQALYVEPGVNHVFDIKRQESGRAALVLHTTGGWAATVLNAAAPDSAKTTYYPALELWGIQ